MRRKYVGIPLRGANTGCSTFLSRPHTLPSSIAHTIPSPLLIRYPASTTLPAIACQATHRPRTPLERIARARSRTGRRPVAIANSPKLALILPLESECPAHVPRSLQGSGASRVGAPSISPLFSLPPISISAVRSPFYYTLPYSCPNTEYLSRRISTRPPCLPVTYSSLVYIGLGPCKDSKKKKKVLFSRQRNLKTDNGLYEAVPGRVHSMVGR